MSSPEERRHAENFLHLEPKDIPDLIHVPGVPALRQDHAIWCGYTSLAMLLQHQGHAEITPSTIFEQVHGEPYVMGSGQRSPSLETLAVVAEELTPHKVDIWDSKKYRKLEEKLPDVTPYKVAEAYIRDRHIPVMVRFAHHYNVLTGLDKGHTLFTTNEPVSGREIVRTRRYFNGTWSKAEPEYPGDTRYLMMAVHGQRKL